MEHYATPPPRHALLNRQHFTQAPSISFQLEKSPTPSARPHPQRPAFAHKTSIPFPQLPLKTPEPYIALNEAIATAPARVPNHARDQDIEDEYETEEQMAERQQREREHRRTRERSHEAGPSGTASTHVAGRKRARHHQQTADAQPEQTHRVSKRAKLEEREQRLKQQDKFKEKYTRAFPSFRFYFDSLDPAVRASLASRVQLLGARIEDFFSNSVTHFITNKAIPSPEYVATLVTNKENSPNKPRSSLNLLRPNVRGTPVLRSPIQLRQPTSKFDPLVTKAVQFGQKVYGDMKLDSILFRLLPNNPNIYQPSKHRPDSRSPAPQGATLSHLLQAERNSGLTHERDPNAPRRDYKYFGENSYFVLIEDMDGTHAPIAIKEYGPWPRVPTVLENPHSKLLAAAAAVKRKKSAHVDDNADEEEEEEEEEGEDETQKQKQSKLPPWPPLRDAVGKAKPNWAEVVAAGGVRLGGNVDVEDDVGDDVEVPIELPADSMRERPQRNEKDVHFRVSKLRRTASMHDIGRPNLADHDHEHEHDVDDDPFHHPPGRTFNGAHVLPGAHPADRDYVAASGNSVVITSHNNSTTSYSTLSAHHLPAGTPLGGAGGGSKRLHQQVLTHRTFSRAAAGGSGAGASVNTNAASASGAALPSGTEEKSTTRVLRKSKSLGGLKKGAGMSAKLLAREESKKAGYCENCRARFEDFDHHISGKRHRRFAADDNNFWILDDVLSRLTRQKIATVAREERMWYEEGIQMIPEIENEEIENQGLEEDVFYSSKPRSVTPRKQPLRTSTEHMDEDW